MDEKKWSPPKYIYLQIEDEWGEFAHNAWDSEVSWCDEIIYESDVKYVRVDMLDEEKRGNSN